MELLCFKLLWILDVFQPFLFTFPLFLTLFLSILLKLVQIVNCSVINSISKEGCSIVHFELLD